MGATNVRYLGWVGLGNSGGERIHPKQTKETEVSLVYHKGAGEWGAGQQRRDHEEVV